MNCKHARNLLLRSPLPAEPAADVRAHLAKCATCREWQRRLLLVEKNVPRVPVPPSRTKVDFIRRVTTLDIEKERARRNQPSPRRFSLSHRSPLLRWSVGLAAAAAVLLAVGWFVAKRNPQVQPGTPIEMAEGKPLLDRLVQRDLQLVSANNPRERIETLAALANDLQGETPALATEGTADDMKALAQMYDQVVNQGIVKHASRLAPGERRGVLEPIARQLDRAQKNADQLADRTSAGSAYSLREMAETARKASETLQYYAGPSGSAGNEPRIAEPQALRALPSRRGDES